MSQSNQVVKEFGRVSSDLSSATKTNVTQLTSITTGVTASGVAGVITTVSSTLAADATTNFTVTNTRCLSTSVVIVQVQEYGGAGAVVATADNVADGSFDIRLQSVDTVALDAVIGIGYIVL